MCRVQDDLLQEIGDFTSEHSSVVKAIQNVELLKAEGLSVAQVSNPLSWFANSQREYLQQRLRHLVERHIETVTSVVAIEVCIGMNSSGTLNAVDCPCKGSMSKSICWIHRTYLF